MDGVPYVVLASQFGRKSMAKANMQCKLKNLKTGAIISHNFQGSEKIEPADVGYRKVQFLYKNGDAFTFMDLQSYDQYDLTREMLGDVADFLIDGNEVDAMARQLSEELLARKG